MSTPQHPDDPVGEPAGETSDAAAAGTEDAAATPAAVPAAPRAEDGDDLDARFLAIVSGIAPSMRWQPVDEGSQPGDGILERTQERTQDRTGEQADRTVPGDGSIDLWRAAGQDPGPPGDLLDRPGGPLPTARPIPPLPDRGSRGVADTADERSRRRAARRQERAEELAAFEAEKAEREREHAEDDAHYEPPPPPPLPRLRGRTVAALLVSAAGVLLLARPTLLQLNQDVSIVLAVLLILGGLGVLVAGLHRPPTDGSDGWDDGARV